ncbi:MAG: right-handed parallel beta-helix repeat-containing protein, partial [Chlamydiales bacterium]|nr:right-handed parallel beta-helix repeat-containing protein [Chlamydiales bacterium]
MNVRNFLMGNICLLAALGSMQTQAEAAKKNQKNPKHSSCSSSSRSSNDNCCKEVLHDLDKKFACDKAHVISSVPAVIDKPGKWCVKKDLVYKGSGTAITITANNVTLNFNNHSLTLENPSAIGVYANTVQELTVLNDIIKSTTISTNPISRAFYILNCEKVTLDNIFTANTFYGVDAVNSKDVFVTHSRFKDHIGGTDTASSGSIRVENCNAVVVEESTFSGAGKGSGQNNPSRQIVFRGTSTACRISNCEFAGVEQAVGGFGIDGLIVENCVMQTALVKFPEDPSSPLTLFLPLIQLSTSSAGEILASNVTVRNCVLNGNLVYTPDCLDPESPTCTVDGGFQYPIYIGQAHAILIDSCEI